MITNLYKNILLLHNKSKTYTEIAQELSCARNSVVYYLSDKEKARRKDYYKKNHKYTPVSKEASRTYLQRYITKWGSRAYLSKKLAQFRTNGNRQRNKIQIKDFNIDDLLAKLENKHICYLTGMPIDLTKTNTYVLDHIIPSSKGGSNSLSNLGLSSKDVNRAKSDKTPQEFFALCKQVLEYNGYTVQEPESC